MDHSSLLLLMNCVNMSETRCGGKCLLTNSANISDIVTYDRLSAELVAEIFISHLHNSLTRLILDLLNVFERKFLTALTRFFLVPF